MFRQEQAHCRKCNGMTALSALNMVNELVSRTTAECFQRAHQQKLTAWKCVDALCIITSYWDLPLPFEPLSPYLAISCSFKYEN